MPYKGSYIWKIRQKIDHDLLVIPSADAVAVRGDGALLMVYNRDANDWFFPGGYAEDGQTSDECAARELREEGGIDTKPNDLIPFAFCSGHKVIYANGDVTMPFTQLFYTTEWQDLGEDNLDASEIAERRWVPIDEIQHLVKDDRTLEIVTAYRHHRESGKYTMINLKGEVYDNSIKHQ